jgi:O-antigen ligase
MNINAHKLSFRLICLYSLLTPLGMMVKFGKEEGSLGITTFILLTILIISLKSAVNNLFKNTFFVTLLILIFWLIFASVFSYNPILTVLSGVTLILYLFTSTISFEIINTEKRIYYVFLFFCLGGLISSSATIIDFFGVIKIPGVNETQLGTNTELGSILQASGPFARRSSMAIYFTMIITIGILYASIIKNISKISKLIFYFSAITCLVALMLTHNRSGIVSAIIVSIIILFLYSKSTVKKIKFIFYVSIAFLVILYLIITFLPDVWYAYQALLRIGDVASTDTLLEESDALRFELFKHSISSILRNPIGHGYSLISDLSEFDNGLIDPHNIITQIIWGAGFVGLLWLFYFTGIFSKLIIPIIFYKNRQINKYKVIFVFIGVLASFFVIGMMHTVISTGMVWIFFGCFLQLSRKYFKQDIHADNFS